MDSIKDRSGSSAGVWIIFGSPCLRLILYSTEGAVSTKSKPYSRVNRSCTISMCNKPKNRPEAESQSRDIFWLKFQCRIIQLQLINRISQQRVIVAAGGKDRCV